MNPKVRYIKYILIAQLVTIEQLTNIIDVHLLYIYDNDYIFHQ